MVLSSQPNSKILEKLKKKLKNYFNMPEKITGKIVITDTKTKIKDIKAFEKEIEKALKKEVTDLIELIFTGGISLSASDIHFEPEEKQVRLRIRLDGMLHDVLDIPNETYHFLLSRIKLLAGLKLNVHNKPQDGSFTIDFNKKEIEIRTSALPAQFGESIVMRILNPESLKSIEQLGLRKDLLDMFKSEIKKPNGMIIVTGPTGSGKTTTLYAFLKHLEKPEIKIITIEDPIEYRLDGISQTQVDQKKGYDFASGLRSIVRQDPDVILVGEIRDLETAKIALQASLTGHLVFSTLHTNDAAGTIPRLTSLGAEVVNIAPALNMVVAQRLVRKICSKCAIKRDPTPEEIAKIKTVPNVEIAQVVEAKRCEECNMTGYKGRIAIFEAFLRNDELETLILKKPSIPEIKKAAKNQGMLTMYQDGILKVLEGVTTIEEIERVATEK